MSTESLLNAISHDIESKRKDLLDYRIIEMNNTVLDNHESYYLKQRNTKMYNYSSWISTISTDFYLKQLNSVIDIRYVADEDLFNQSLPVFWQIVKSLNLTSEFENSALYAPIIKTGSVPFSFGYNPSTKILYVSNAASNTISVINTRNNQVVSNIAVGQIPQDIAINTDLNQVYVANTGSKNIAIIDGLTNKITGQIDVGFTFDNMVLDPYQNLLFISDSLSSTLSIIDTISHNVFEKDIPITIKPVEMKINPITKQLFFLNQNYSVISMEYFSDSSRSPPQLGSPAIYLNGTQNWDIAVDQNTNKVYVSDNTEDIISVIDGFSLQKLKDIPVSYGPRYLSLSPYNDQLFVSHQENNTITIINRTTNEVEKTIHTRNNPLQSFYNGDMNIAYVSDIKNNGIFIIDGKTKNVSVGLEFVYEPAEIGYLNCNNKNYTNHAYAFFDTGSRLICYPVIFPNYTTTYQFSSLQYLDAIFNANFSEPPYHLEATNFGTALVKFTVIPDNLLGQIENVINSQFHDIFYSIFIVIIVAPIISWAIPYYISQRRKKIQLRHIRYHYTKIDNIYNEHNKYKTECLSILEEYRKDLVSLFHRGILEDSSYVFLNTHIVEYQKKLSNAGP
ncbi:Lactonase, 7-bladed beta-propeller [Candidatus Nitrosocosmicus oleophilus]|uniref:Lactonase, 7-bladed beta-propeller n=1 Tax=Candidatus Nitrosocosmicus oleophilus TaxID=1353260 RepID=A0A654LW43_9ARCH|nr:YncE family protein [Candidatus Nitrosocosmicus oleophilus]ALI35425.1 Lactonase, 7-bladed beta-propeller [Candidatus Nitrosocosmicus oleophilus]